MPGAKIEELRLFKLLDGKEYYGEVHIPPENNAGGIKLGYVIKHSF
jgi:hypothetical protein